jgi:hypothetical protein
MSHRKSDFITLYRMHVSRLLEAQAALEVLRQEWDALDYGNTLVQETDFIGENAEITKAQLADAVTSVGAIGTTLAAGHRTNLYKVRE